ncbi:MAG: apolipoprotein N-acyltransferase [Steroidobacteraceae bacterium]
MADSKAAARRWLPRVLALAGGAALTFAFAPYGHFWLALLAPALLLALWGRAPSARDGAWLGFCFGVGLYAVGTWWLYISIRGFGQAPVAVALLVMGALVVMMAAWQALLGYVACRWLQPASFGGRVLWVPAAWLLVEWLRGWFLSGFPWLSLGYSQTDSWLAGLAPVGGVYLLSLALLVSAGALLSLWWERGTWRAAAMVALVLPWTLGLGLRGVEWTQPGKARQVAILQGAIPQDMKWQATNQRNILDTYARLHQQALGADLIVWPESALPDFANLLSGYVGSVWSAARQAGSAVVMGIMRVDDSAGADVEPLYFNSVLAMGEGEPAFYDKRHLVPFGEYFPVPAFVRQWLRLMSLPYSDFTPGAREQPPLQLAGMSLAASICYEDAYGTLLRPEIRASDALVTVTNDAWFGRSGARYQHLQIARMLAMQSRRPLLRAANDGVSALIGPDGRVEVEAAEFAPAVLRGTLVPRTGDTPYLVAGNALALGLALALLLLAARAAGRVKRSS